MDWSDPVGAFEDEGWVDVLVPQYQFLLQEIHPLLHDQITARHWVSAQAVLDLSPQPATPEAANQRWRQFVAAVWGTVAAHHARRARRPRRS